MSIANAAEGLPEGVIAYSGPERSKREKLEQAVSVVALVVIAAVLCTVLPGAPLAFLLAYKATIITLTALSPVIAGSAATIISTAFRTTYRALKLLTIGEPTKMTLQHAQDITLNIPTSKAYLKKVFQELALDLNRKRVTVSWLEADGIKVTRTYDCRGNMKAAQNSAVNLFARLYETCKIFYPDDPDHTNAKRAIIVLKNLHQAGDAFPNHVLTHIGADFDRNRIPGDPQQGDKILDLDIENRDFIVQGSTRCDISQFGAEAGPVRVGGLEARFSHTHLLRGDSQTDLQIHRKTKHNRPRIVRVGDDTFEASHTGWTDTMEGAREGGSAESDETHILLDELNSLDSTAAIERWFGSDAPQ